MLGAIFFSVSKTILGLNLISICGAQIDCLGLKLNAHGSTRKILYRKIDIIPVERLGL